MNKITDDLITAAIRGLGMAGVQRFQQELIEAMRNGDPRGYAALRRFLRRLEKDSKVVSDPDAGDREARLWENLLVIKAAYGVSGGDLSKTLHWFRAEPLSPFGKQTAAQLVSAGQVDDVIRLIDSYRAGAAG